MILADTAPDAASVTPGVAGFLTFFALAVIVVLLVLNMSKHLRRIDARAAQQEAEEAAARGAASGADPADSDGDAGTDAGAASGEASTEQPATGTRGPGEQDR